MVTAAPGISSPAPSISSAHPAPDWDLSQASELYGIQRWGAGYFGINSRGHMSVRPMQQDGAEIDILEVVESAREHGLQFPLLIRFQDLLRHRVKSLNEAFRAAIQEADYKGEYRGVFPIKVNQLREVVEEIVHAGAPYHYGLEAGSKPELFAAMAMHEDYESLIICNGYKDRTFIETALLGCKLGKKVVMVVEKIEELRSIIDVSRQFGVDPYIGIRVRLQSKGAGKWATSGGEDAKFGLPLSDLLDATEMLRQEGLSDRFILLHFHIGSQIPEILTVKRALREATRYFAKIRQLGFGLQYLDVGGGLAVDYDGSRTANDSSMNYTLDEYTRDIVWTIKEVCDEEKIPHPNIVSESGRAIVAHHSVLVVDVFGVIEKTKQKSAVERIGEPAHKLVADLLELRLTLNKKNRREHFHDVIQIREDAQTRFDYGLLDLKSMAQIDTLFWEMIEEIVRQYPSIKSAPSEVRALIPSLSDQFLCNFSVFQSMLDHWALGQLFPISPIHRLDEKPDFPATIVDITCDSDGKISKFICGEDNTPRDTLLLHNPSGSYYLGFFLMGAYQDIMGDLHNLFGRVNEAHVFLDADEESGFYIEETIPGNTIIEVLRYVQHDTTMLGRWMKAQVDAAIKADRLKPSEGMRLLAQYEQGLNTSTYLQF
jgi:arginine decarboxylase